MSGVAPAPRAWGTAIFCDDIRSEVQGTTSLIGMYGARIFINGDFPFMLPKLAILVKFFEDPSQAFKNDGVLKIFAPLTDDPVFEMVIPFGQRSDSRDAFMPKEDYNHLDKLIVAQIPVIFAPIRLEGEGSIKVRLYVDDLEYRIGAIIVKSGINPNANVSSPPSSQSPPAAPAS